MERVGKLIAAAQLVEMLTMVSLMKVSLPRLPPAAPATLGVGLVMGAGGVMMGSQARGLRRVGGDDAPARAGGRPLRCQPSAPLCGFMPAR